MYFNFVSYLNIVRFKYHLVLSFILFFYFYFVIIIIIVITAIFVFIYYHYLLLFYLCIFIYRIFVGPIAQPQGLL